jgi:hypothetical protein
MKVPVTHGERTGWGGELATWTVVGFSAGVAAGFLLGEMVGTTGGRRIVRMMQALRGRRTPAELRSALLGKVREALRADLSLAGLTLEVGFGSRGRIELQGWVGTRHQRSHAYRLALETGGVPVLNRILVRGEDDRQPFPAAPGGSPRSA